MRIYYLNQLLPISEPLDMRDAHANLKDIKSPDECKVEYDMILEDFARKTISDTLKEIRSLSSMDESFSS
jgi:hypothetical protein